MRVRLLRLRGWTAAAVGISALVGGACTPAPSGPGEGPPPGSCPGRTTMVLQRVVDSEASQPQEFSSDGSWLLTSFVTDADELELSLRSVDALVDPVPVARLEPVNTGESTSTSASAQHARDFAVTDSGDVTVIGQPSGQQYGVWTWTRSTGDLVADPAPQVVRPAGHDAVLLLPTQLSEDATHTVWLERTTGPDGPASRTILVETATGEVIGVSQGTMSVSNDATVGVRRTSNVPPHPVYEVVDLRTGAAEELTGLGEALVADEPNWFDRHWFTNNYVSDGGRYVALRAQGSEPGPIFSTPRYEVHIWDRVTGELQTAPIDGSQNPGPVVLAVADDGRTLIERSAFAFPAPEHVFLEFDPVAGIVSSVDRESVAQVHDVGLSRVGFGWGDSGRPSTGDLHNFARTYVPFLTAPTAELRIARCS